MPRKSKRRDSENEQQDNDLATESGRVESPDVSASGDEETIDGLNERDEAVRAVVEDLPGGSRRRREDVPVFDRGEAEEQE